MVVDLSSNQRIEQELVEAKGAGLIEAPLLGSIPQVRDGKLFALVAGGSGYSMKLAVNFGLGVYIQALAESLAPGARQCLTLDQMLDVLLEAPYASGWLKSKMDVLKGKAPEVTLNIRKLRMDIMRRANNTEEQI